MSFGQMDEAYKFYGKVLCKRLPHEHNAMSSNMLTILDLDPRPWMPSSNTDAQNSQTQQDTCRQRPVC